MTDKPEQSSMPDYLWAWPSDTGMKCSPEMHTGIAVKYTRKDIHDKEIAELVGVLKEAVCWDACDDYGVKAVWLDKAQTLIKKHEGKE